ncbi:hypothetical protein, partial [Pontibacter qinzhouensis]|uniref:hypothetical protein n=1 Tax=Pontibacter qinzhouensis TaxID=2603253 RepID=UPI001C9C01D0
GPFTCEGDPWHKNLKKPSGGHFHSNNLPESVLKLADILNLFCYAACIVSDINFCIEQNLVEPALGF